MCSIPPAKDSRLFLVPKAVLCSAPEPRVLVSGCISGRSKLQGLELNSSRALQPVQV